MRRNRILYIIMALAFLVFSIVYQSRISAVLLIAAAVYPVIAALCAFIASRTAEAGFIEKREVHPKETDIEIWLYVRSRSILPLAPVELQCNLPDRDTGLFCAKRVYAAVPPFGKCRISVSAMHLYRGSYVAEISRISVFDPLRIICVSRKISSEETLVFLPRRLDIGELPAEARGENSSNPAPLLQGEREDFSHVREYRPGDIMQLVHWKLTAKLDDLMIKQYDEATEHKTAVVCDYTFEGATPGAVMKQADAVIEAAIAFAQAAVKSGDGALVDFGAYQQEFRSVIRDMGDFESFYDMMSVLPAKLEVMDINDTLRAACRSGTAAVLLITCRLTDDTILAAQTAAENFHGEVALVWLSRGTHSELESQAEGKRFLFIPIRGEISELKTE